LNIDKKITLANPKINLFLDYPRKKSYVTGIFLMGILFFISITVFVNACRFKRKFATFETIDSGLESQKKSREYLNRDGASLRFFADNSFLELPFLKNEGYIKYVWKTLRCVIQRCGSSLISGIADRNDPPSSLGPSITRERICKFHCSHQQRHAFAEYQHKTNPIVTIVTGLMARTRVWKSTQKFGQGEKSDANCCLCQNGARHHVG